MRRLDRSALTAALLLAGAAIVLAIGWKVLWFLTDDAYIAFRYISNAHLGYGYVWNAPPFRPVEGYTSLLWVLLLDGLWRLLGVDPPSSANTLSLLCSLGTLLLTARMVWRLPWDAGRERAQEHERERERERLRLPLLALVLAGVVTHRSFLTWSSSGLETALFNLLLLAWVHAACWMSPAPRRRPLALASLAALLALTRPDGLLFVAATLAIAALEARGSIARSDGAARGSPLASRLWTLAPLLVVAAHLLWRRSFYGAWLPNTYFAKYTGPWPESGWRYALSFALEYGHWLWLAAALWLLLPHARSLRVRLRAEMRSAAGFPSAANETGLPAAESALPCPTTIGALVVLTLLAHVGYYTLIIGGDHFEYRVYSHLPPLLMISLAAMANLARLRRGPAVALLAAAVLLSWPLAWGHWSLSRRFTTREETFQLRVAVAPHWPVPVRWYASGFDRLQDWLIDRVVCVRHQEHRVLRDLEIVTYPTRAEGASIGPEGEPVFAGLAVGVPGWVLPRVHVIDLWGLNDYVVARSDRIPVPKRQMAHDREPPAGYVECFQPNVFLAGPRRMQIFRREPPLTDLDIAACEARWRAWLRERPRRSR